MLAQVTIDVSSQAIADIMVGAMECNDMTRSWVAAVRLRAPTEEQVRKQWNEENWYAAPQLWEGPFTIDVWEIADESKYDGFDPETDDTPDYLARNGIVKHTLTEKDLTDGIAYMAKEEKHSFANWVQEEWDAITADVFLQCVVLRETVYG